jgi:hypothetical protein
MQKQRKTRVKKQRASGTEKTSRKAAKREGIKGGECSKGYTV